MLISRSCRPIKIGFVVDPTDAQAIRTAIEINSFLWGGQFNPIIPFYRRRPRNWSDLPLDRFDRHSVFHGYLTLFDPDIVVPVGNTTLDASQVGCRELVRLERVLGDVEGHGAPNNGVGLFEVLDHLIGSELRFVRSRPIQFRLPRFSGSHELFLAALFGSLEATLAEHFKQRYAAHIGIEESACSHLNYVSFLNPDNLFLRRIGSLFLRTNRQPGWGHESCIFFCDSESSSDVVDFWNLRALGWKVFPVPRKAAGDETVKQHVSSRVEATFAPYRSNPNLFARTTLVKSRRCTEAEATSFIASLPLAPTDSTQPKLVFQRWYPRMWDRSYWQADDTYCCVVEAGKAENEFPDSLDDTVRVSVVAPSCIDDLRRQAGPRFANNVYVQSYAAIAPLAEAIPECDDRMCEAIQALGHKQWRFSDQGMVYFPHYSNESIWMKPPVSQQVFIKWMEWLGWHVSASSPGRLAGQLLRTLGGVHGVGVIAQKRLLQMLGNMAGKCVLHAEVKREVSRIANEGHLMGDPGRVMDRLVERGVVRLGVEIQCPTCSQRSWHSLSEIDYEVRCPKCEDHFVLPSHAPDEMKWAYRARGAFDLPNKAQGVYCVLLLARFFSEMLRFPTTPVFGIVAKKGAEDIEVDYGAITEYQTMMERRRTVVFAECKTFNKFLRKDVHRMEVVRKHFNEAVLVFATLNDTLNEEEQRALVPLVKRCRPKGRMRRERHTVVILTGNELFAQSGPPYCWEEMGEPFKKHSGRHDVSQNLESLGEATQEIYLGMSSR